VTGLAINERPRPRSLRSGAFFLAVAALGLLLTAPLGGGPCGSVLAAQEPDSVPQPLEPEAPDTLPRPLVGDSVRQDTVPEDTLGPPPPQLPAMDPMGPASFARGVWEWDRSALRRLPALSLLGLLERLPGVVPVRVDIVNQPEGAAVFGATAAGIRYVVDGFEIDPLTGPTFDPSRMPLLALESVRVERRLTGVTVRMRTMSPDHPRPRSIIEAGTGDYDVNLFRGIVLAPGVLGGPVAVGFERLGGDGYLTGGNSNHVGGWLKWTWVRDGAGVQIEYRQSDMDRAGLGEGLVGARRDWVVRGRASRGAVKGEVYAGASSVEDDQGDGVHRESTPQGGVRFQADLDAPFPVEARAAARFRSHPRLPRQEVELGLRAAPFRLLAVEGEIAQGWMDAGDQGRWTARAQAGPLLGVTVFGELFGGEPLAGDGVSFRLPAAVDSLSLAVTRDGARAGAELAWGGLTLAGATVRASSSPVSSIGIRSEPRFGQWPEQEATGVEAMARIPTGWAPLWLEGWYVRMDAPGWLYVPEDHFRASVVYHHMPLPSGNLELYARVEHVFRGGMAVPAPLGDDGTDTGADPEPVDQAGFAAVTSYRATNLELMIRVVTVRAFIRWENARHRLGQEDLPGFPLPGQRIMYGVKWDFLN
jgi:hypothetical protein